MVEKVVEIQESGLPLVFCVEVPQPVEFTDEACKRGAGDIGGETLVSVAAVIVEGFCDATELLAAGLGEAGFGRGGLPFRFVSPRLKARLAAVTAVRRLVQQKASEDATSDGSAESVIEYRPNPCEISDTFGKLGPSKDEKNASASTKLRAYAK